MAVSVNDISRALAGAEFPASKEALVLQARVNGASAEIIEAIDKLDRDLFHSVTEVEALFD